ncbi:VOC family protein [Microbispora corallina]|uniref:Glyoxalase n=1 Tax=Microbispora corallina TaxID=83302 RepID=A0ABQ4FTA9_9ACTN|nr:VOC family protein [Microbispora corallina]GIH38062.1 glyoxalase [Microbispora corallina]
MTTPAAETPAFGTVAWFEIATDDPDGVQRFYGDLFGWRYQADEQAAAGGMDYRIVSYPTDERPQGGVFGTGGERPNHAVFCVHVADVAETCDRVEGLGGKVVFKAVGNPGGPDFAYLHDTSGNLFGVFAMAGV